MARMRIATLERENIVTPMLSGIQLRRGDLVELLPNDPITMKTYPPLPAGKSPHALKVVRRDFKTEYVVGTPRWLQAVEYEGIHRPNLLTAYQYLGLLIDVYTPYDRLYETTPFWSTSVSVYVCVIGCESFFITNDNVTIKKLFSL